MDPQLAARLARQQEKVDRSSANEGSSDIVEKQVASRGVRFTARIDPALAERLARQQQRLTATADADVPALEVKKVGSSRGSKPAGEACIGAPRAPLLPGVADPGLAELLARQRAKAEACDVDTQVLVAAAQATLAVEMTKGSGEAQTEVHASGRLLQVWEEQFSGMWNVLQGILCTNDAVEERAHTTLQP
mmetsp:Transcript_57626/g.134186  ORF Transcript_57626/g.134186 Transcript_57626/m.134186 type:complete len:191 (+) Transcript_57626:75-647(+)